MSQQKKKRRTWLFLAAPLTVAAGVIAFGLRSGSRQPPIPPSLIVAAKRGTLAIDVVETGKITPRERVEVKSKVAGQVAEVLVSEGDRISRGQMLLTLDPIDYQRELDHALADVAQAKNALDFARLTLKRRQAGVASGVVTSAELDLAVSDLAAKEVALRVAQIALATSQDRLRYTKITAPMAGTVIQRNIQPGEVVVPGVQATFEGRALLTIADLSVLLVKIELNQIDVARVRPGQAAELTLDAVPGKKYAAKVVKVAPASVRAPGKDLDVFPVEAQLTELDPLIMPGMTADVRIHVEEKREVLLLPMEAIVKEGGKSFVTRVLDDPKVGPRTEKVEVSVGARNDRDVEILAGIDDASRILLNPPSAAENETKM